MRETPKSGLRARQDWNFRDAGGVERATDAIQTSVSRPNTRNPFLGQNCDRSQGASLSTLSCKKSKSDDPQETFTTRELVN